MQMTPREIISSFNRADNKRDKVVILAELNACDKNTICKILREGGVEESLIPDFSKKTITVTNQDKKGGNNMARKASTTAKAEVTKTEEVEQTTAQETLEVPEEPKAHTGEPIVSTEMQKLSKAMGIDYENKDALPQKKVVPKAVIEVVKTEMQRLCEVILEAEAKRAELAAFIVEAE